MKDKSERPKVRVLIVCDDRYFDDYKYVKERLDLVFRMYSLDTCSPELIAGSTNNMDRDVKIYALDNKYAFTSFIPNWDKDGKSAGYKRNEKMCKYLSQASIRYCIVFSGCQENKSIKNVLTLCYKNGTIIRMIRIPT